MNYKINITKKAKKDIHLFSLKQRVKLFSILSKPFSENPYLGKKLFGDLVGKFSYRFNQKDRIVYDINEEKKVVYIRRARTHYGE